MEAAPDKKNLVAIERTDLSLDMQITWSLTNLCNFHCVYCPDFNRNGSEKWLSYEIAAEFVDRIAAHYIGRLGMKKILISFTGGEPATWRDFGKLCAHIRSRGIFLGLTTNGSARQSVWEPIASYFEWMSISFHPAEADADRLMKLLRYFHDRPDVALPTVRLMMPSDRELWNRSVRFAERMRSELDNWSQEFVTIQNDFGVDITPSHYDQEQLAFLRENDFRNNEPRLDLIKLAVGVLDHEVRYKDGTKSPLIANDLVNRGQVDFRGWECDAGMESLFVDYFGRVFRAGCLQGGCIGKLQELSLLKFPAGALRCKLESCTCPTNVMISKRKRHQLPFSGEWRRLFSVAPRSIRD